MCVYGVCLCVFVCLLKLSTMEWQQVREGETGSAEINRLSQETVGFDFVFLCFFFQILK